jgi:diguanylate cyclase
VLEVPEAAMLADPAEVDVPGSLRRLGAMIALDDFGTSYSCLTLLDRLPLDVLKIDRRFVGRLGRSDAGAMVVSTMLQLATGFGLPAVAEGIETEAQLQALLGLGCRFGQGFHFSRPIPPDRVGGLLAGAPRR